MAASLVLVVVALSLAPALAEDPSLSGEDSTLLQMAHEADSQAKLQALEEDLRLQALEEENAALKEQIAKLRQDVASVHAVPKPPLPHEAVSLAMMNSEKKHKGRHVTGHEAHKREYMQRRHRRYWGLDINRVRKGYDGKVVVFGRKGCGRTDMFEEELGKSNEASLRQGKASGKVIEGVKYAFKSVDDDKDNTELWAMAEKYDRQISMLPVVWVCDKFLPEFYTFDGIIEQAAEARACAEKMSEEEAEEETAEVNGEGKDASKKEKEKAEADGAAEVEKAMEEGQMAEPPKCDKEDLASNCGMYIEMMGKDGFCETNFLEYCERTCLCE